MFSQFKKNLKKQVFNPKEEDVLAEQFELISDALVLVKEQINGIDLIGNATSENKISDELRRAELLSTKKGYLEFFYQVADFLFRKVKTEEKEDLKFYLPSVRTLFDIYAKLLYLANHSLDEQMLNCIYERLYYLKKISSQEEFEKNYLNYKPYLDDGGYSVPDFITFSKKRAGEYLFPSVKKIIENSAYLEKFKPIGFNQEINVAEKYYLIYGSFSEYAHGNMLNKHSFGNEDFWIIRNILFILLLTIYLVDCDVLEKKNMSKIDEWIRKLTSRETKFGAFYDKKRVRKT